MVIFGAIMAFSYSQSNSDKNNKTTKINSGETKAYFDDASPVMYFWSPLCTWCQKEEIILNIMAKDGYRLKNMNVYEDNSLYEKYSIDGTPTFMVENGEKLIGYQDEVTLRDWLDKHGAKIN